jgi:hypothetical protein
MFKRAVAISSPCIGLTAEIESYIKRVYISAACRAQCILMVANAVCALSHSTVKGHFSGVAELLLFIHSCWYVCMWEFVFSGMYGPAFFLNSQILMSAQHKSIGTSILGEQRYISVLIRIFCEGLNSANAVIQFRIFMSPCF